MGLARLFVDLSVDFGSDGTQFGAVSSLLNTEGLNANFMEPVREE